MYNDMMDTIGFVRASDPEVGAAMQRELSRQRQNIELIASENIVSPAVMAAMGSVLTNKYAEGYPAHRYYGGSQYVDEVENIAIARACELFGAKYANVQPHSGAQANLAVYFALLDVGDTVMGMDLSQGGHLTHGSPVNMSGKTTTSSAMASTKMGLSTMPRWPNRSRKCGPSCWWRALRPTRARSTLKSWPPSPTATARC